MIELTGEGVDLRNTWRVANGLEGVFPKVSLSEKAIEKIKYSRDYIENRIQAGDVIYGVNTGFGAFSDVKISEADIVQLQKNLIRSHSTGVGEPFTKAQSRAIMYLRANALSRGHSGIRVEVIDKILEFLNNDVIPVIPQQGSVGASGDLAPLSHLALALIGEGEVWDTEGKNKLDVEGVLKQKNIEPLVLKSKEGLSLINGCPVQTAGATRDGRSKAGGRGARGGGHAGRAHQ